MSVCDFGDTLIESLAAGSYTKKKDMAKGVAFPTCVSVNNCVCHYSPLKSDDSVVLKKGDFVKMCAHAQARARARARALFECVLALGLRD
jgi:methionine aminopeptidase